MPQKNSSNCQSICLTITAIYYISTRAHDHLGPFYTSINPLAQATSRNSRLPVLSYDLALSRYLASKAAATWAGTILEMSPLKWAISLIRLDDK